MLKPELPAVLSGIVKPYSGNGRKLGYPTANIASNTTLPDGVYFGFANLLNYENQPTLIFVGTPTTVGDTIRRVEAHLLDIADTDYYEQSIRLTLNYYHRPNETFESVDALLEVMKQDEIAARKWFT